MLKTAPFQYVMLYTGPKDSKATNVGHREVVFARGPEHDRPYAHVNEAEGKALLKRAPDLFQWADNAKPGAASNTELEARVEALEERLALLEAKGRRQKAEA